MKFDYNSQEAFIIKKILLIGSLGLLLGACAGTDVSGEAVEADEGVDEIVESVEVVEQTAVEIPTSYPVKVTKLKVLTEEDHQLRDELMEVVTEHSALDRDAIYNVAPEYGRDPEELWQEWLDINEAIMNGNGTRDKTVLYEDILVVVDLIFEAVFPSGIDSDSGSSGDWSGADGSHFVGMTAVTVDEVSYKVEYSLEFDYEAETATLTNLVVDGSNVL